MQLAQLIPIDQKAALSTVDWSRAVETNITGITADSRAVRPGFLFAAMPGTRLDGSEFVVDAIRNGAAAVLTQSDAPLAGEIPVPNIRVQNPRRVFAQMSARYFERQPETVVAVTGTAGKSSVAEMVRQIWTHLGFSAASIGTIGVTGPDFHRPLTHTTLEPSAFHALLDELAGRGIDHLCFEASSHGLAQSRVDGARLKAGAFTSFGRDHRDYHASEDDYLFAKLRLFGELLSPGTTAVINADDPASRSVEDVCWSRGIKRITVGRKGETIRLVELLPTAGGQTLRVSAFDAVYVIHLPLTGAFQASNALIAAGLAIACGAPGGAALMALTKLQPIPGRLEHIADLPGEGVVYVDYAHKPDALEAVLDALRPHAKGRLICVFGCGGDRDRQKRGEMGAIAAERADVVIVTDDNPRTEDPAAIRATILATCPQAQEIADRGQAITTAIGMAESGDIVLIAGKGHETGQIIGDKVHPFNDADEVRAAISARENIDA